ncbi:MAG: glycoside hydrolase family 2 TIM barrel-domain containing protein [Candidatus Omnitrophota bacterium]
MLIIIFILLFWQGINFAYSQTTGDYVTRGWAELGKRNFEVVYQLTGECVEKFSQEADRLAVSLSDFPLQGKENLYSLMNDVATCYFIKGEALMREGKIEEATEVFEAVVEKYPFAQSWDPRGWFWSIKEKAEITLRKLKTGRIIEDDDVKSVVITKVTIYDQGKEFPVNYKKYGEFQGVGTAKYKYIVNDPIGLSKAVGEAVFPNSTAIKFDPKFIKIKKNLFSIDHWQILNSRDLNTAFYKWNLAPEPPGVKQFYIADILERSGLLKAALKAYYAVLVHFPETVGWTYWQTPWYIGKVALYRIKNIIKNYPELNLELKDASIEIINGFDNDIRNDQFIVNPGRLIKRDFLNKIYGFIDKKRNGGKIIKTIGESKIKLVKYESGDWQLLIDGKPAMIKAVTYAPTPVGQSPDEGSLSDWTVLDSNNNGLLDGPYEAWVDRNGNNLRDDNEPVVGDFQLMKDMGVNAIRMYHQPFELNKKVFGKMHDKYGIYVIIGDFLGKYTLGSGAAWQEGTDYDNLTHQDNMLESVRRMVIEFKDEPYVFMWLLGNENVYGLGCNADKKPESFFKFANRAAKLIKELDPYKRPVAIASGDVIYLDLFARECPAIDIFGANAYRGRHGFLGLWDEVKRVVDKPVMLTEYGSPSYAQGYSQKEAQEYQAVYHENAWQDIRDNSCGYGAGNALGGIVFEWLDEWWKAYEPGYHDKKGVAAGPFLGGYYREEWFGLCGQGEGTSSPFLRHIKDSYFTYKRLWN